jgi:hypothetical protein
MELRIGQKVQHKLTGEAMFVLEIGPQSKRVFTGQGWVMQEYLPKGAARVRLMDMRIIDVFEFEIEGIDPDMKMLLCESARRS